MDGKWRRGRRGRPQRRWGWRDEGCNQMNREGGESKKEKKRRKRKRGDQKDPLHMNNLYFHSYTVFPNTNISIGTELHELLQLIH